MMKKRFYISVVYIGLSFSCIFLTSCEILTEVLLDAVSESSASFDSGKTNANEESKSSIEEVRVRKMMKEIIWEQKRQENDSISKVLVTRKMAKTRMDESRKTLTNQYKMRGEILSKKEIKERVEKDFLLSYVVMTRQQEEQIRDEMLNQLRQKNTNLPSNQRIDETVLRKVVKRWDPSFIYRAGVD